MGLNLVRKTLCLVKSESVYGTDPTPSSSTDCMILYGDGNILKPNIALIDRKPLRKSLTRIKQGIGRHKWDFTPQTVLMSKGVSTGYGAPFYDPLLKACGMAAASGSGGGSSSTVYTPTSSSLISATAWVYADGLLMKANGLYGGFTVKMTAGDDPDLNFTMDGLYNQPTSVAFPASPTYPTDNSGMIQSVGLTIGSYGDAQGLICREVMLNWGTTRPDRGSVNHPYGFKGTHITDRDASLEVLVEYEDTLANKNFWSDISNGVVSNAISMTVGDLSQSGIVIAAATPQPVSLTPGDDNGIRTQRIKYNLQSLIDEGELSLTFKEHT